MNGFRMKKRMLLSGNFEGYHEVTSKATLEKNVFALVDGMEVDN